MAVKDEQVVSNNALLFVVQAYRKAESLIFDAKDERVGTVPAPYGYLATDRQGNLYDVPDYSDELLIFRAPYRKVATKINYGKNSVWGVAVDRRTGVFALIVQAFANGGPGPFSVDFYQHGAITPCTSVQAPDAGQLAGGAFDREGRLYLMDYDGNNGNDGVGSITGECKAKALKFNSLPADVGYPNAYIDVSDSDDIVFQGGNTVYTFTHPIDGQFAEPIAKTVIGGKKGQTIFLCLSSDGAHLWAAPFGAQSTTLAEYKYPTGGQPVTSIFVREAQGCAITPPLQP